MKRQLAMVLLALCPIWAHAGYPDHPIKFIAPFPAGSGTDVVARILAEEMSRDLGQPIIIDNKGGAQGIIGMQATTSSPPDGYTIVLLGVTTGASNVSLFKKLPYDPMKDLTILGMVGDQPLVLVTNLSVQASNAAELFALARREPGKLSYGYGSGSAQVACAKLVAAGDIQALPVPYKGSPQTLTDLLGGRIDFTLIDLALALPQIKAGKIKVLGVTTKDRFPLVPDVPTLDESGVKGYELSVWFALAAPAGLPEPVVERLSLALKKALASPDLQHRFADQAIAAKYSPPAQAREYIRSEIAEWGRLIKAAGIEPQD